MEYTYKMCKLVSIQANTGVKIKAADINFCLVPRLKKDAPINLI